jgi:pimeloyl-ACP methyl ester carboxylesterase
MNRKVEMPDFCKTNVVQLSEGDDALILIHGFGENHYSWGHFAEEITAAYSVFAVDLRGHGDSDWDPLHEYNLDKFVADLTFSIDNLGLVDFSVAGHSMGADVALRLALAHQARVAKVILVEFSLDVTPDDVLEFTLAQFNAQFRIYKSLTEYNALLTEQRPLADPAALMRYSNNSVRTAPGGGYQVKCDPAIQSIYTVRSRDFAQQQRRGIANLASPLLVVRGSGSAVVTQASTREITRLAPSARLSFVRGAGHSVMLDRPKDFNDALADFLLQEGERDAMSMS